VNVRVNLNRKRKCGGPDLLEEQQDFVDSARSVAACDRPAARGHGKTCRVAHEIGASAANFLADRLVGICSCQDAARLD
jgi:hypothetical protein